MLIAKGKTVGASGGTTPTEGTSSFPPKGMTADLLIKFDL